MTAQIPQTVKDFWSRAQRLSARIRDDYSRWRQDEAKDAAELLTLFYDDLMPSRVAEQTIDAEGGGVEKDDAYWACDTRVCDRNCGNLPSICNEDIRQKLVENLGKYLAMFKADATEAAVERTIGPSRMVFYKALVQDPDDDVRKEAALYTGKIPLRDVRPIKDKPGSYVSFTISGLLHVALRNPGQTLPDYSPDVPSSDTIQTALLSVRKIVDSEPPISIRDEIQRATRIIRDSIKDIDKAPGPWTEKQRSEIFFSATELLSYVQALPLPPKPPETIPDPWTPTVSQIPDPQPFPPPEPKISTKSRIAGVVLGATLLVGAGVLIFTKRPQSSSYRSVGRSPRLSGARSSRPHRRVRQPSAVERRS